MRKNRRGYYFSLDAFLALVIILGIVLFIKPSSTHVSQEVNVQYDLLEVLSNIKIVELDNSEAQALIFSSNITNLNQSVLEQIGEFYANSDMNAEILANSILNDLGLDENVGLYFNNMLIANSNETDLGGAKDVWTSRQIISGINNNVNSSSSGFSSRAFLFSENKFSYFYLGGYIGDGNITLDLGENVVFTRGEAVFSGPFNLSVNGGSAVSYNATPGEPFGFNISSGFVTDNNYLYFTSSENLYIAGGFVKSIYNESQSIHTNGKFKFPGIKGLINIYDSFYVPGLLQSMEVFLNYTSPYNVFFTIGNRTLYSGNGTNVEYTLTDAYLRNNLNDYLGMDYKTIPFRFGLENVSYVLNLTRNADVFSVTDLSGSMGEGWCSVTPYFICNWNQATCEGFLCNGVWTTKLDLAKQANNVFIDAVLSSSINRVGLIGYEGYVRMGDSYDLSNDVVALHNVVAGWNDGGGTCICCGINEGVDRLNNQSVPENFRSIVVMTDGEANVHCPKQGVTPDLNYNGITDDAGDDAIKAACDAYDDYGIIVYAIAFGDDADKNTTEAIADCGGGDFYSGNVSDLVDIYEDVAEQIINAAYSEQTIVAQGVYTEVYPSSYISVDFDRTLSHKLLISAESPIFGSTAPIGNFSLPFDAAPYEVSVTSYSGSRWTSKVEIYDNNLGGWNTIFNLSEYGDIYTELGDPYLINIPLSEVRPGENSVRVSLGVGSENFTSGSQYNKIIYSVAKNISGFSPIVASAKGCIWTIEFEDGTNSTMVFPPSYSGTEICSYTSAGYVFNPNDAIDYAIYDLLLSLDLDGDGRVETKFEENELTIASFEVNGIPFVWETEVQARVWR
ncbi:MAG: VWA domain-containing protein [Nanoarchaeota archaeon]|nr:VWA domain-containing protein [Nanoarchaeota archaeon]MBU1027465.1 VWA domain-containing protein [Nanoarchaeota archaeon]